MVATITVVGNLTADPELRFTPSGAAVANFTVASTPRIYDRQSGEWKDGDALFLRCNIWREAAENVAESLMRGSRVIVTGRLKQRSFETREVRAHRVRGRGRRDRTVAALCDRQGEQGEPQRRRWRRIRRAAVAVAPAAAPVAAPVVAAPRPRTTRGAARRRRDRFPAATTNRPSDSQLISDSRKR